MRNQATLVVFVLREFIFFGFYLKQIYYSAVEISLLLDAAQLVLLFDCVSFFLLYFCRKLMNERVVFFECDEMKKKKVHVFSSSFLNSSYFVGIQLLIFICLTKKHKRSRRVVRRPTLSNANCCGSKALSQLLFEKQKTIKTFFSLHTKQRKSM
jgi:hypothetical protein